MKKIIFQKFFNLINSKIQNFGQNWIWFEFWICFALGTFEVPAANLANVNFDNPDYATTVTVTGTDYNNKALVSMSDGVQPDWNAKGAGADEWLQTANTTGRDITITVQGSTHPKHNLKFESKFQNSVKIFGSGAPIPI